MNWSASEGLKNVGLGANGKSPKYLLDSTVGSDIEGYSVLVQDDKKIVGFYVLLRSAFNIDFSFGGGGLGDLGIGLGTVNSGGSSEEEEEVSLETIMALGIVTFDEGNPRCGPAPSVTDQYIYEWVFANLDANFDRNLDQSELSVLIRFIP